MNPRITALFLFGALPADAANLLEVDLSANGASRVYDYFSNAYAQVDLDPDGMYDITTNSLFGPADVFPSEGNWAAVGTLELDGPVTGVGIENFTIVDATFDFDPYIDGDLFTFLGNYTTSVSIASGTADFNAGVLTSLSLNSDIAFGFAAASGPYDGTFDLTTSGFTLSVDDTETAFSASLRYEWDAAGGSTYSVVPESASFAFLAGLLGLGLVILKRRRH